jgi:gliding motility-associated-like protein
MPRLATIALVTIWLLCIFDITQAQQIPRMTSGGTGYLEKLPPDYSANPTKKYPVLFFLHGTGETGNGSPSELEKVKVHGPPKLIEGGHNMCFLVNGVEECFIVISPQLKSGVGGWWPSILNDIFDYVLSGPQNYRIDKDRVYLTGLSLGGQGVYIGVGDPAVADIFAAGAPVSGFGNGNGCLISSRKIPMWGFHGESDGSVTYDVGLTAFNNIRYCTSPVPTGELKWTSYTGKGHDIWENYAYRTDNNLHDPNLYQWLLTKSKNNLPKLVINNPSPTCSPLTIDITASNITAGSSIGMSFSYWMDIFATIPYATPNAATDGLYYIKGTLGIDDIDIKPISVTINPKPNLSITNPPPVCPGILTNLTLENITAGSSGGLIFSYWTDPTGSNPLNNPTAVPIGSYYIKGTSVSGCSEIKPVIISANTTPTVTISNPPAICAPSKIDLTNPTITAGSSAGNTYTYWTNSNATNPVPIPTSVTNGIYYIKGTNSVGCSDIKQVTATVNALPILLISNQTACAPANVDITLSTVTSGSSIGLTFSYWQDSEATIALLNPQSVSSGTYYIKGINSQLCSIIKPISITINDIPNVLINDPTAVCEPTLINLTSPSITSGSSSGLVFSYWTDSETSDLVATPTAVKNGTYYIKGTNSNGCSSIKPVTARIYSKPLLTITNPLSTCSPSIINLMAPEITIGSDADLELDYWNNIDATIQLNNPTSIAATGTYYIKAINSHSCYSIKPVQVTINEKPNLVITQPAAICSPMTLNLSQSSITSGSSSGLTYSYWTNETATNALNNPNSATAGTYYIKATNAFGCQSIKPITVVINPSPSLTVTNPPAVCEPSTIDITNSSVTVGSSTPLNFSYWIDSSTTKAITNPASVTNGIYYIKATNSFGCSITKSVFAEIKPMPISIATPANSVVCSGSSSNIQLSLSNNISGGATYAWNSTSIDGDAEGYSDGTGNSIVQTLKTNNKNGTIRYTITPISIIGGCLGPSITADLTVTPIPDVSINIQNSAPVICNGCSTYIVLNNPNAVIGTEYSWNAQTLAGNVSGYSSGSGTPIIQKLNKTSIDGSVRYTIVPKSGNCEGSLVAYDVKINLAPTVNAGNDLTIQLPIVETTLHGDGVDTDGTITSFFWNKLSGPNSITIEDQNTPVLKLREIADGVYRFRLIAVDNDGGVASDEMLLTVLPKTNISPIVSAGQDLKLVFPANTISIIGSAIDPDGVIKSTKWSQVSGAPSVLFESGFELQVSELKPGSYMFNFSATDNQNETVSDDVLLEVIPGDLNLPNSLKKFITPNGDGQNDSWELDPSVDKFADCKLTIVKNDGTKVLETIGYKNDWDGTHNGAPLPRDVYYFILECNDTKQTGSITIIR